MLYAKSFDLFIRNLLKKRSRLVDLVTQRDVEDKTGWNRFSQRSVNNFFVHHAEHFSRKAWHERIEKDRQEIPEK